VDTNVEELSDVSATSYGQNNPIEQMWSYTTPMSGEFYWTVDGKGHGQNWGTHDSKIRLTIPDSDFEISSGNVARNSSVQPFDTFSGSVTVAAGDTIILETIGCWGCHVYLQDVVMTWSINHCVEKNSAADSSSTTGIIIIFVVLISLFCFMGRFICSRTRESLYQSLYQLSLPYSFDTQSTQVQIDTEPYVEPMFLGGELQNDAIPMEAMTSESSYINSRTNSFIKGDPSQDAIQVIPGALRLYKEDVILGKQFSSGGFAKIFIGEFREYPCALKKISFDENLDNYIKEGELFKKASRHQYICSYFGCAEIENQIYLVIDLYEDGSVLDAMRKQNFNENDKLMMCYQIASGLLHLKKENVLHCDLAARNCLIKFSGRENLHTAITDFGLSCSSPSTVKMKQIAPRWASPDLLTNYIPTHQSDIWAFGVTCWEIFTNGLRPYENYGNSDVIVGVKTRDENFRLKLDQSWTITPLLQQISKSDIEVEECVKWLRGLKEDMSGDVL